jgi:hypothetical protein
LTNKRNFPTFIPSKSEFLITIKEVIMFSTKAREETIGKMRHMPMWTVLLAPLAVLILGAATSEGAGIPFADAEIYFELNNTDEDLGIHALIDGDAWKRLDIRDPNGRRMLNVRVKGRLVRQGLTELFFESAEPGFDNLAPEEFFDRFPEGEYRIKGTTLEGVKMEGMAEVTHLMPAPPANVLISGVPAAEDCDAVPLPVVSAPVTISWDAVTLSHPDLGEMNEPIVVEQYQVVVEEEASGFVFSVELPPNVTEVTIPEEMISLGDEFKFEILVREDSGNQTAVESCFEVE